VILFWNFQKKVPLSMLPMTSKTKKTKWQIFAKRRRKEKVLAKSGYK